MELFQFIKQRAVDPSKISAAELDANFAKLKPLQGDGTAKQYLLTETPQGWYMNIFPKFPSGGDTFVLGCVQGTLTWIATEEC